MVCFLYIIINNTAVLTYQFDKQLSKISLGQKKWKYATQIVMKVIKPNEI